MTPAHDTMPKRRMTSHHAHDTTPDGSPMLLLIAKTNGRDMVSVQGRLRCTRDRYPSVLHFTRPMAPCATRAPCVPSVPGRCTQQS
jgi:hypothetical protein